MKRQPGSDRPLRLLQPHLLLRLPAPSLPDLTAARMLPFPEVVLSSGGLSPPPSEGSPETVTPLHTGPGRKKSQPPSIMKLFKKS